MSIELTVATEQFDAALKRYLEVTSKSAVDALNGKARDLMYQAAHYTPIMQAGSVTARGIEDVRALAVYRRRAEHQFPPFKRPMPFTTADVLHSMAKIKKPSRGYMKSGFVKAALKHKKTEASLAREETLEAAHVGTKAFTKSATEGFLEAVSEVYWQGKNQLDGAQKEAIVKQAFDLAVGVVYNDMVQYLWRKQQQAANEVSAKAGSK